jgi:hypothetical protein
MGRTAHFLSALAVAGAVLVAVGPAAAADPSAEVSPGSIAPGGSVTVSVSCGALGVAAPETLQAASQAFADGAVELTKVPGDDAQADAAYRGTAVVAPAAELEASPDAVGPDAAWTVDGTCPAAPGGAGKPWSATLDIARAPAPAPAPPCSPATGAFCPTAEPCPRPPTAAQPHPAGCRTAPPCVRPEAQSRDATSPSACPPATVDHGVRAGAGGAFTDSVPALAAGGLLIAGALGAAAHRLRRRRGPAADV